VELATAAGLSLDDLPAQDEGLWLALASQTVAPAGADLDMTAWLGVIAALTLWGAGTQADAEALATYAGEEADLEAFVLEEAFGAVDGPGRPRSDRAPDAARLVGHPRGSAPGLVLTAPHLPSRSMASATAAQVGERGSSRPKWPPVPAGVWMTDTSSPSRRAASA
jgi:hypothetical protein